MSHLRKIAVIGLGYVGLPIAVEFGKKNPTIAFDIKSKRISQLQQGIDTTLAIEQDELCKAQLILTSNPTDLNQADFYIIAVPTPIDEAKQPDLSCLLQASEIIGNQLKKGDIVVYESTVYPGVTEEECAPVLEKFSGLKCGVDFFLGYSPERINPSDSEHTFAKICKIVSGQNEDVLKIISTVYASVVTAGIYEAPSIKVAEAAKIIENTQRDINIALMNELAIIFAKIGLDTNDILKAAGTKWNFLNFKPGLVGGHCIGVDPYYLTHKAKRHGINPEIILAGRRINDGMGKYIAEQTIKNLIKLGKSIYKAKIAILGLTFKENCNDIRNTKVIDIINELRSYQVNVLVHDPLVDPKEAEKEYGIKLQEWDAIVEVDAVILAVAHNYYLQIPIEHFAKKIVEPKLIIDIKSIFDTSELSHYGINVWRL